MKINKQLMVYIKWYKIRYVVNLLLYKNEFM
jgi:hypothetical protein